MATTAIIMVAGRGTRLRTFTDKPKSTLPVNDVPLIRRTVTLLLDRQIKVALAIGYQHQAIKDCLQGLDVTYFYNPFFDVTNSIASLWFAQEFLSGDVILFNGDVWFDEQILDDLLAQPDDLVMLCDQSRVKVGDYFFQTDDRGILRKFGKELPLAERTCEYVGFAKVSQHFLPQFTTRLNELIDQQQHHLWWENVIYSFCEQYDVHTIDTNGRFWGEVDTVDDYKTITKHVKKGGKRTWNFLPLVPWKNFPVPWR